MSQPTYELNTGIGKTGKSWYQLIVIIGKYRSEPLFISELEFDYLQQQKKDK